MKLTARTRSAVAAMTDLALHGAEGPVTLSDMAVRQHLSVSFLEQIFGRLRRAGLVESRRGACGGYVLALPPEKITVRAVVAAVDEDIRARGCRADSALGCQGRAARCLTHDLWQGLDRRIEVYLTGVSLADLAAPVRQEALRA